MDRSVILNLFQNLIIKNLKILKQVQDDLFQVQDDLFQVQDDLFQVQDDLFQVQDDQTTNYGI